MSSDGRHEGGAERRDLQADRQLWDAWAEHYDRSFLGAVDPSEAVTKLAELATDGPTLELAIGTGRIAIPLARSGVEVDGIELSEVMAAKLEAKATGLPIRVIIGDMAEHRTVDRPYALIYAAYSALHLLPSQEQQIRCVANVALSLAPGGHFVVEATHPQVFAGPLRGKNLNIRDMTDRALVLSASVVETAAQTVQFQEVSFENGKVHMLPCHVRWIWPAELDLMAAAAGLVLVSRSEDWTGKPLTSSSTRHVSVYRKDRT